MAREITIDGRALEFEPGQTILEVASANGIDIPTLCYLPETDHRDVCRICVVEVAGADRLLPACSTPATDGMDVQTMSERVRSSRRATLELLVSSGRHTCITCEALGDCELSRLSYEYEIATPTSVPPADQFPFIEDECVIRDYSKCILCGRCWAACTAIQVNGVVPHPSGRRAERHGGQDWFPLPDLEQCEHCGQCVDVCPVGALTERTAKGAARAWELQRVRSTCAHCGMGCQTTVHLKDGGVVKVSGVADAPPSFGRLCSRGRFAVLEPDDRPRLEEPLIRKDGALVKAGWGEALDFVAGKLGAAAPGSVAGLVAPLCTNEEAYQAQRFFRAVLGTNDIDHRPASVSEVPLAGTHTGAGVCTMAGPVTVLEEARALLVVGDGLLGDHPVAATAVRRAVREGAYLMVVDAGRSDLGDAADVHVRVEAAAIPQVLQIIAAALQARAAGEPLAAEPGADDARFDTGPLQTVAAKLAEVRPAAVCVTLGPEDDLATTAAAAMALQSLLDDLAGARSVSLPLGSGNAQGLLAMGVGPDVLPGDEAVGDAGARQRLADAWGVESLPAEPGRSTAQILAALKAGELSGVWLWANEAEAFGPSDEVLAALKRADLVIVQGALRDDLAEAADVVLPALAWGEEEGTVTNVERRISRLRRVQRAPGLARSGWWAFREVARRLGHEWPDGHPRAVWDDEIRLLIPSLAGVTYAEIEEFGLCWPAAVSLAV